MEKNHNFRKAIIEEVVTEGENGETVSLLVGSHFEERKDIIEFLEEVLENLKSKTPTQAIIQAHIH